MVLVTVDDRLVRRGRRAMHDRAQPVFEPSPPCRASPLVTNHSIRNSVQPKERLVADGDIVEATPRGQERLGHGIVDQIARYASATEVVDRSVVAIVKLSEQGFFAGWMNDAARV